MEPFSSRGDLFLNIKAWDYKKVTISHPEAGDYYAVDEAERQWIDDQLVFWGFSGERTVWCSSTDREVIQIDLKEMREVDRIETALTLQYERSCLQNYTVANELYLAAGYSGLDKMCVQYYDINKAEGFKVLQLAEKAGWVNRCWLHNHWFITAINLKEQSISSSHLVAIDLKNDDYISTESNQEFIDSTVLLSDELLAVSSTVEVLLLDLSTGDVLKQVALKTTSLLGSLGDSLLAIDDTRTKMKWLNAESLREISDSHLFSSIGKVEQLTETDLFMVIGEHDFLCLTKKDPLQFKAVRLKPDRHLVEELMTSRTFTVPNPMRTFCDMKWGRFAYMNTDNLQLVIMDFAAGKDDPVDIVLTCNEEEMW